MFSSNCVTSLLIRYNTSKFRYLCNVHHGIHYRIDKCTCLHSRNKHRNSSKDSESNDLVLEEKKTLITAIFTRVQKNCNGDTKQMRNLPLTFILLEFVAKSDFFLPSLSFMLCRSEFSQSSYFSRVSKKILTQTMKQGTSQNKTIRFLKNQK